MKSDKILISGASIAGPTLAYWLHRYGFEVTVVEKSAELRLGGQNIDVKGPARVVAEKMGIVEEIRAKNTTEAGIQFVNASNKVLAEFSKDDSMSMTQELEILRGDLVKTLYDHTKNDVVYRFGDHITSLDQIGDGVNVGFASGNNERFDLVISTEGIGSSTRKLAISSDVDFKYLGLHTAYLTIPKTATDGQWARWHNAPSGIVFMLRPDNYGETRASVTFLADENQYKGLTMEEQKKALIERIKGAGWQTDRFIEGISKTKDLYFDRVSQVKASSWSAGRVAIAGDAAWCATPIAGKGTDLAMAGAYILAGELFKADHHEQAFEAYEKKMRPYVEACQKLPPGIPGMVYPTSKFGVAVLNKLVSAVGSKPGKWLISFFTGDKKSPKVEIALPDYTS